MKTLKQHCRLVETDYILFEIEEDEVRLTFRYLAQEGERMRCHLVSAHVFYAWNLEGQLASGQPKSPLFLPENAQLSLYVEGGYIVGLEYVNHNDTDRGPNCTYLDKDTVESLISFLRAAKPSSRAIERTLPVFGLDS